MVPEVKALFDRAVLSSFCPEYTEVIPSTPHGRTLLACVSLDFYHLMVAGEKTEEYRSDKTDSTYWRSRLANGREYDQVKLYGGVSVPTERASWAVFNWLGTRTMSPKGGTFTCGPYSNGSTRTFPATTMWAIQLGVVVARNYTMTDFNLKNFPQGPAELNPALLNTLTQARKSGKAKRPDMKDAFAYREGESGTESGVASEYGGDIDALAANIVALQRDTLTSAEFQKRIASLGKTFPDHAYINTAIQKAHSATSNATTGPLSQNQKAIVKVGTEVKGLKEALQPHMDGIQRLIATLGKENRAKAGGRAKTADGPRDGKQDAAGQPQPDAAHDPAGQPQPDARAGGLAQPEYAGGWVQPDARAGGSAVYGDYGAGRGDYAAEQGGQWSLFQQQKREMQRQREREERADEQKRIDRERQYERMLMDARHEREVAEYRLQHAEAKLQRAPRYYR